MRNLLVRKNKHGYKHFTTYFQLPSPSGLMKSWIFVEPAWGERDIVATKSLWWVCLHLSGFVQTMISICMDFNII